MKNVNPDGINMLLSKVTERIFGTMKKTVLLLVTASLLFASCKKEEPELLAGANGKNSATVSAPTGPATLAVYPVRAPHNTGYDSATDCAPSSWNCGSAHSNSDWNTSQPHYGI